MSTEELELVPSGLITCILNNIEVRIIKISKEKIEIRTAEKVKDFNEIKIEFYKFKENIYEEVILLDYEITEESCEEFQYVYKIKIKDNNYSELVGESFKNYYEYIKLKVYGDDNEFSKEMVSYPYEKDYDFYEDYAHEKKAWMSDVKLNNIDNVELALSLDNYNLYEMYLNNDINEFKNLYFKENYLEDSVLINKDISRIYVGNEFCHNLFPHEKLLMKIISKAWSESLNVTLSFTDIRECYIEKTIDIIEKIYSFCVKNKKTIEVVINDWGMIEVIKNKKDFLIPILGTLLNKRKKDPRYMYKKGYEENKDLMAKNNLNSSLFNEFLRNNNISRFEFESCGYDILIPKGKHSLHLPFYVTNVSQYCPLYAMCNNSDRGKQILADNCPKYCKEYVFTYPKHLKMIGRYNSLFAFDDTILSDFKILDNYLNNGINRLVFNFL